jgi:hypothetical protein
MIQASGEQQLPASAEIVRERLRQMHWLVSQMPNLARVELVAEERARFVVRPGFSFLRGEMTVQLERLAEPDGLAWRMEVRGIGSSAQSHGAVQHRRDQPGLLPSGVPGCHRRAWRFIANPTPFLIASCRRKNRAGFPCQFAAQFRSFRRLRQLGAPMSGKRRPDGPAATQTIVEAKTDVWGAARPSATAFLLALVSARRTEAWTDPISCKVRGFYVGRASGMDASRRGTLTQGSNVPSLLPPRQHLSSRQRLEPGTVAATPIGRINTSPGRRVAGHCYTDEQGESTVWGSEFATIDRRNSTMC